MWISRKRKGGDYLLKSVLPMWLPAVCLPQNEGAGSASLESEMCFVILYVQYPVINYHRKQSEKASLLAQKQRICLLCRRRKRRGLNPGLGRCPGEGSHSSVHSCLQKPTDRGIQWGSMGVTRVGHDAVTKPPSYMRVGLAKKTSQKSANERFGQLSIYLNHFAEPQKRAQCNRTL